MFPAQVIPVNYLRWDFVTPEAEQRRMGRPQCGCASRRIISMNAVDHQDGLVVMGEVSMKIHSSLREC